MTEKCIATTKSGNPCKNVAREGYQTCYAHRAHEPATDPVPAEPLVVGEALAEPAIASDAPTEQEAQFQQVLGELDELAMQLKALVPGYNPPPFSAEGLLELLKENADKFAPEVIKDLRASLEGAEPKDFLDVDTWKGMWFILNYSLQEESRSAVNKLSERVSRLPGMSYLRSLPGASLVQELGEMLSDASPKDFLDVDTWKGMWFVVNYSLQNEAREMKNRIFGEEDEEMMEE